MDFETLDRLEWQVLAEQNKAVGQKKEVKANHKKSTTELARRNRLINDRIVKFIVDLWDNNNKAPHYKNMEQIVLRRYPDEGESLVAKVESSSSSMKYSGGGKSERYSNSAICIQRLPTYDERNLMRTGVVIAEEKTFFSSRPAGSDIMYKPFGRKPKGHGIVQAIDEALTHRRSAQLDSFEETFELVKQMAMDPTLNPEFAVKLMPQVQAV